MSIKKIIMRIRDYSRLKKGLVSVLIFIVGSLFTYYFTNVVNSGYPLFLLFLPLMISSSFYIRKWNFLPPLLATISLLILSIAYYGEMFFEMFYLSVFNLTIFSVIFSIVGVLIGYINYYFAELRKRNQYEVSKRKEIEEKRFFLNSVLTHDIRNQLQVTEGYLKLIQEESNNCDSEKIRKAIDSIQETLNLADNIKKISSVEHIDTKKIDSSEFKKYVETAIERNKELLNKKDIKIESDIRGYEVHGNFLLGDIVHHLIENSIYHSNCGVIKVSTKERKNKVITMVEDDGKGIPVDQREKIFGFKDTKKPNSVGLGLFLVKKIVRTYNGKVKIKDSDLGGAKFEVILNKT